MTEQSFDTALGALAIQIADEARTLEFAERLEAFRVLIQYWDKVSKNAKDDDEDNVFSFSRAKKSVEAASGEIA